MVQAVWSTAHGHPLRMTDLHGEQISRLAAHVDPILVLFAPLWWLWPSPRPAARRAGDRGRTRRGARLLARAQAPRIAACRPRLRARLPALSGDRLADAERVPSRRARGAAPALRVLVPRRGPAAAVRPVRARRRNVQGGDRARDRGLRGVVRDLRTDDPSPELRSRSPERRGRRSRLPSSFRTSTPARRRTSTAATARSAARQAGFSRRRSTHPLRILEAAFELARPSLPARARRAARRRSACSRRSSSSPHCRSSRSTCCPRPRRRPRSTSTTPRA